MQNRCRFKEPGFLGPSGLRTGIPGTIDTFDTLISLCKRVESVETEKVKKDEMTGQSKNILIKSNKTFYFLFYRH